MKVGAERVDLDGNSCGVLEEQHVEHARQQLEEAKARVQAQRAEQQAKKRSDRTPELYQFPNLILPDRKSVV